MTSTEIYVADLVRNKAFIADHPLMIRVASDGAAYGNAGLTSCNTGNREISAGNADADYGIYNIGASPVGSEDSGRFVATQAAGVYYLDHDYGSGMVQVGVCDNDMSLILFNCVPAVPFCLCPHKKNELYLSCFHEVTARRVAENDAAADSAAEECSMNLSPDLIYISDSTTRKGGTHFAPGKQVYGFLILINEEEYASYLSRFLHESEAELRSSSLLSCLLRLDGQIRSPEIQLIARNMFHFSGDRISSQMYFRSKVTEIISILLASHPDHRAETAEKYQNVRRNQETVEVEKIIHYMSTHLSDPLTTEDLARQFCSSPSRLTSMFKKATSQSLSEFRNRLRVQEATKLLTQTQLTQEEIALRLGFCRVSNFSDFFRRETGKAPGTLRKSEKAAK